MFSVFLTYVCYKRGVNVFLLPLVFIAVALVFNFCARLLIRLFSHPADDRHGVSSFSRLIGGLIGGLKGLALAVSLLFCIQLLAGPLNRIYPAVGAYLEGSALNSYFKQIIRSSDVNAAKAVYYAGELLKREPKKSFLPDETVRNLQSNSSLKAVIEDEDLMQSLKGGDYKKIFSSQKFLNLLKDKEFLGRIASIDFEAIYEQQEQK